MLLLLYKNFSKEKYITTHINKKLIYKHVNILALERKDQIQNTREVSQLTVPRISFWIAMEKIADYFSAKIGLNQRNVLKDF